MKGVYALRALNSHRKKELGNLVDIFMFFFRVKPCCSNTTCVQLVGYSVFGHDVREVV